MASYGKGRKEGYKFINSGKHVAMLHDAWKIVTGREQNDVKDFKLKNILRLFIQQRPTTKFYHLIIL